MSEVTKDKAFDRAVDLVINQDHVVQQWTGRYIAIQTSLAVAASAFLAWKGPHLGFVAVILTVVIGSIAIALACAVTQIITREYEWQKRYVEMVRKTEGNDPLLYQEPSKYEPLPGKDIPKIFAQIQPWIIVAWIVFIILSVVYIIVIYCQVTTQPNNPIDSLHSRLILDFGQIGMPL